MYIARFLTFKLNILTMFENFNLWFEEGWTFLTYRLGISLDHLVYLIEEILP